MSISELMAKRQAAGERYSAALLEFRDALTDLAGLDAALDGKTSTAIRSFGPHPDIIAFRHPVFAPDVDGHLPSEVTERRNLHLATLKGN